MSKKKVVNVKTFTCHSCGKTSEKIGVCSIARQTLNVASGDYTNLEIDETLHGFCLDCAAILSNAQLKKLTGLTARKVPPNYQRILNDLVDSTTPVLGATVSLEALNKARKVLGYKAL